MKQYRKTEYNIQFRKKSFIILMFVLTVFEFLLFLAMDNSFDFLILTNKTETFSESTFPPVLNAILYELALLLPTFFVFWGFFSVKYDQNSRCNVLRAISFDCKKTVKCQYEWGIYMMLYFILVGIGVSFYWQNKFNDYIGGAYEFVCSFDFIVKLLYKILCIALVSTISISAGKLVAYLNRNIVVSLILCLVIDQIVLGKSWVNNGMVLGTFSDSKCFITAGDTINVSLPLGAFFALGAALAFGLYEAVIYLTNKRYVIEESN